MKRITSILVLVFTAALAHADYVIQQKIDGPMSGDAMMKIKGEKMRMDMPNGPMGAISTILDLNSGDMTTLIHTQKMAMTVPGAQTKQMMEMMKQNSIGKEAPKLEATGKVEKVGDYNTEIYTWSAMGMTQTLWVAKDFPNAAKIKEAMMKLNNSPLGGMGKTFSPDMSKLPGMVVKSEANFGGQKITTTLISVKEENVDASAFEVPADYKKMAAPAMPNIPQPAAK